MILVDTSVWIDHLHRTEPALQRLLGDDVAATHDGVIEEIALGSIAHRGSTLALLGALRRAPRLRRHDELQALVDRERLWARGLSVIDVQLLGSARLARAAVWTRDKRLLAGAADLGVAVFDGSS